MLKKSTTTLLTTIFLAISVGATGCLPTSSEAAFTGGRTETRCDGTYPACKGKYAGCRIDEQQYISGTFPGSRKLLVETIPGDWVIQVKIFLADRLSPGTETEISWYEPGCSDQYHYQLSKDFIAGDLFERAGTDQVFEVEQAVIEAGDHLIEVYSDATARYDLRVDIRKVE